MDEKKSWVVFGFISRHQPRQALLPWAPPRDTALTPSLHTTELLSSWLSTPKMVGWLVGLKRKGLLVCLGPGWHCILSHIYTHIHTEFIK